MGNRSVIIIGAGIAGLSAGCYARMNGYDTHILEMHDEPGGFVHRLAAQGLHHRGMPSLACRLRSRQ